MASIPAALTLRVGCHIFIFTSSRGAVLLDKSVCSACASLAGTKCKVMREKTVMYKRGENVCPSILFPSASSQVAKTGIAAWPRDVSAIVL